MHGLAQVVVAAEGEGEVAHAAAHVGPGEVGADPCGGADEVERIAVVFLHARGHGEDVGVEDDVGRGHLGLLGKEAVGAPAHGDFAFVARSLPFFVEGHHHHGRAVAAYGAGVVEEGRFALLQGDGIDHGLSLHAL